jgi:hypothetical protein
MELSISLLFNAALPVLVGAVLWGIYATLRWVYDILMYEWTVTLEITTDQELQWSWLQHYITEHLGLRLRQWSATGTGTEIDANVIPTTVRFPFGGKVVRLRISDFSTGDRIVSNQYPPPKTRRRAVLWTRHVDKTFFSGLLAELKRVYIKHHEKSITYSIPIVGPYNNGESIRPIQRRGIDTLTLDPDMVKRVLGEVDYFLSAEGQRFMIQHGIPYHLGLLLEGPPGNGKSSFILALASRLGSEVCKISFQTKHMDDTALACVMRGSPHGDPPRIIVLEDVDCLTRSQNGEKEEGTSKISFSALLNCLDGLGAPENAIIIMTTNHVDRLDAALIRPGRVDCRVRFEPPDDARIAEHYVKFFPEETVHSLATTDFVKTCRRESGGECSMAVVQGQILRELAKRKEA